MSIELFGYQDLCQIPMVRYSLERRIREHAKAPGREDAQAIDLGIPLLLWLGGEDSNPQRLDQNQLCYQLHHPRTSGNTIVDDRRDQAKTT